MMKSEWWERTEKETKETLALIERDVASGVPPTDAINRNAHTAETYSAALKQYGLKPVIPD